VNGANCAYTLKWSKNPSKLMPSGVQAATMVRDAGVTIAPKYHFCNHDVHEGMHVRLECRDYIVGRTLREADIGDPEVLDSIQNQIFDVVVAVCSGPKHPAGYLRFGPDVPSHVDYVRHARCRRGDVTTCDCKDAGKKYDESDGPVVLCHPDITEDHVLVNDSYKVVGILGWDRADYMHRSLCSRLYYINLTMGAIPTGVKGVRRSLIQTGAEDSYGSHEPDGKALLWNEECVRLWWDGIQTGVF